MVAGCGAALLDDVGDGAGAADDVGEAVEAEQGVGGCSRSSSPSLQSTTVRPWPSKEVRSVRHSPGNGPMSGPVLASTTGASEPVSSSRPGECPAEA